MTDAPPLPEAAAWYADRGARIFPLEAGQKRPRPGLRWVDQATDDAATVRDWWTRWPSSNIGIALSARALVLDMDGAEAWAAVRALSLDLPATLAAITGRGEPHRHLHYRLPAGARCRNLVGLPIDGVTTRIDTRTVGGYVVVPPSVTKHRYEWVGGWPPDLTAVAECPEWLLDLVAVERARQTPRRDWDHEVCRTYQQGQRNARLASVAGLLYRELGSAVVAYEMARSWARTHLSPPLPNGEVDRVLASIATAEARRLSGGES